MWELTIVMENGDGVTLRLNGGVEAKQVYDLVLKAKDIDFAKSGLRFIPHRSGDHD